MSLAFYAAPFENENKEEENIITQKKIKKDKAIRKRNKENETKKKIDESMMSEIGKIHSNVNVDGEGLADFEPIPRPESLGVNKTIERETPPEPEVEEDEMEDYENLDSSYSQQYYSKFLPGTVEAMQGGMLPDAGNVNLNENLTEKLNYMIHLLEESQEQKTEHVIEEMLLYVGLGVFVIYVMDSFVKIGKYQK